MGSKLIIVENMDSSTLKTIIENNVLYGNIIYTDRWLGYSFSEQINFGYSHVTYKHSNCHFDETSRIEGLLGELKSMLKKITIL